MVWLGFIQPQLGHINGFLYGDCMLRSTELLAGAEITLLINGMSLVGPPWCSRTWSMVAWFLSPSPLFSGCWLPLRSVHSMCACRKTFQESWRESCKCSLKVVICRFLSHFLLSSPVLQREMGTLWLKGTEGRLAYSTPFIAYKWCT